MDGWMNDSGFSFKVDVLVTSPQVHIERDPEEANSHWARAHGFLSRLAGLWETTENQPWKAAQDSTGSTCQEPYPSRTPCTLCSSHKVRAAKACGQPFLGTCHAREPSVVSCKFTYCELGLIHSLWHILVHIWNGSKFLFSECGLDTQKSQRSCVPYWVRSRLLSGFTWFFLGGGCLRRKQTFVLKK